MSRSLFTKANEKLVEVLIEARQKAGLRQADVAKKLGKNQSYVSNIERGQRRVDVVEFYVLAKAMNVDPSELFDRAVKDFPETLEI
ncbi:helix-turn-helix domain-containing protein [Qipengyuania sp. DGS5-3]|uniref:helix-turn-helix domain-containing protein n=1 Tax=Qipengyuania sp. DGS5-3 TaxID=3349632 RepID=UPI0036D2F5D6